MGGEAGHPRGAREGREGGARGSPSRLTIKEGSEGGEKRGEGGVFVTSSPPLLPPSLATVISFLFRYSAYEHEQGKS